MGVEGTTAAARRAAGAEVAPHSRRDASFRVGSACDVSRKRLQRRSPQLPPLQPRRPMQPRHRQRLQPQRRRREPSANPWSGFHRPQVRPAAPSRQRGQARLAMGASAREVQARARPDSRLAVRLGPVLPPRPGPPRPRALARNARPTRTMALLAGRPRDPDGRRPTPARQPHRGRRPAAPLRTRCRTGRAGSTDRRLGTAHRHVRQASARIVPCEVSFAPAPGGYAQPSCVG